MFCNSLTTVLASSIAWRDKNGWEGDNKMSWTAMLRVLPPSFKHVNNLILCQNRFDVGGIKTRNITIQLVLQQCCKTLVARFLLPVYVACVAGVKRGRGRGNLGRSPFLSNAYTVYVMSTSHSGFGMPVMQSWKTSRRITRHHGEDASLSQIHHLLPDFSGFFVYLRV